MMFSPPHFSMFSLKQGQKKKKLFNSGNYYSSYLILLYFVSQFPIFKLIFWFIQLSFLAFLIANLKIYLLLCLISKNYFFCSLEVLKVSCFICLCSSFSISSHLSRLLLLLLLCFGLQLVGGQHPSGTSQCWCWSAY